MQQFLEVFAELKGKNFYLSGESVRPSALQLNLKSVLIQMFSTQACMFHVRTPHVVIRCQP